MVTDTRPMFLGFQDPSGNASIKRCEREEVAEVTNVIDFEGEIL